MKSKKILAVVISAVVVLGAAGVFVWWLFNRPSTFRVLKVLEFEGEATVTRNDIGEMAPYANMVLQSGDKVYLKSGSMTLMADDDKFIYLEEETELVINAAGTSDNSRTTIELTKGAITNDIKNRLSENSTYQVNTPNSTMAVRGTIFRVAVYEENGVKYTKIAVFEGGVASNLKHKDGTISDKEVVVEKGNEVVIYEDDKVIDYVSDPLPIGFVKLPKSVLVKLRDALKEGRGLTITQEKIEKILSGVVTVTFMYNGDVFGVQTLEIGDKAKLPTLSPAPSGGWDWSFDTVIEEDIVINWK